MLFRDNKSFQKVYRKIDLRDFVLWIDKNYNICKIDIAKLNEYLQTKNFLGKVVMKQKRFIVLDQDKPIKMFLDIGSLLGYLQLQANTIQVDFKGYKVKTLAKKA